MTSASPPTPAIILSRPQLGENIGAAARAMANFGLTDLRLVAPRDGWPNERAYSMAAGALPVVESARVYQRLEDALSDLELVYATTARLRGVAKAVLTPDVAAASLRQRAGEGVRCGLLFGNERSGLDNEEVALAQAIITIPTSPDFASLNLGQAVLLNAYEWFRSADATPGVRIDYGGLARPASNAELQHLFAHLEDELLKAGFLYPPDRVGQMKLNLRAMLQRAQLSDQEVRTLRGIIVALTRGKFRRAGSGGADAAGED
jgi:tRNA/rRNA methyltransferase